MHTIAPVPNINGSKASDLADQMRKVAAALEAASYLMSLHQPHGRDYQIGGDYTADRAEFLRRLKIIHDMAEQYDAEASQVMDYHYLRGKAQLQR
jgi:hypothetical protein